MATQVDDATPYVTVLMPVYNGEKYIAEAIESVLTQTYTDFELLVIDDGSRDGTPDILLEYARRDRRVRVERNDVNRGLAYTRNRGLYESRGFYLANLDSDDICLPHRLERQVEFMDQHPDIGICGTWFEIFLADGTSHAMENPVDSDMIKSQLFGHSCMANPSVIMRKKALTDCGLRYEDTYNTAEDYAFWVAASRAGIILYNLPEVLLRYRVCPEQVGRRHTKIQDNAVFAVRRILLKELDVEYTEEEFVLHDKIISRRMECTDKRQVVAAGAWLEKIRRANAVKRIYPEPSFSLFLAQRWFRLCYHFAGFDTSVFPTYYRSQLRRYLPLSLGTRIRFPLKCMKAWCRAIVGR